MPNKQIIFLSIVFLLSFYFVIRMIVKYRLREVHAVMWMIVVCSIPASIIMFPLLVKITQFVGINAPLNFAFFIGFVVLFGLSLHFSILSSGLQNSLKNSIQKIAILENDNVQLNKRIESLEMQINTSTKTRQKLQ